MGDDLMPPESAKRLREPFPAAAIGILPKPYKADSPRGSCGVCGGFHGLPAVHLDYIGHAATTDRLLSVDPAWSWEPFALDERGLPAFDGRGNLWIRLTVCGVTRPGVGDGKSVKECIGDAIRNAAMRFGVALDLWAKEDLHAGQTASNDTEPEQTQTPSVHVDELTQAKFVVKAAWEAARGTWDMPAMTADFEQWAAAPLAQAEAADYYRYAEHLTGGVPPETETETGEVVTDGQVKALSIALDRAGLTDREAALAWLSRTVGRPVDSRKELTRIEAIAAIGMAKKLPPKEEVAP